MRVRGTVATAMVDVNARWLSGTLARVDEFPISNWERGTTTHRRSCLLLVAVALLVIASGIVGAAWLFNSPGLRVAREIYDAAPDIVTRTHYAALTGTGDTLTIVVARDVTRDEALELQCQTVIPLLLREKLSARIVILHPDNDFRLEGAPCPGF